MNILIENSTSSYHQNQQFTLFQGDKLSSNRRSVKRGKWYYELTRISGSDRILAGFCSEDEEDMIQIYPLGSLNDIVLWLNGEMSDSLSYDSVKVPWNISDTKFTVGIGIDFDKRYFYIFYNNFYFSYKYRQLSKSKKFNVIIREADQQGASDTLSINFGSTPFAYNHTSFTPWNEKMQVLTCMCKRRASSISIYLSVMLINKY